MSAEFMTVNKNEEIIEVPSENDLIEMIKERFSWNNHEIQRLKKLNNELLSAHYVDDRLSEMEARLKSMKEDYLRGFPISKEEMESIRKWQKNHLDVGAGAGAIGGAFSYEFIPTSIGIIGTVKCSHCGATFKFRGI